MVVVPDQHTQVQKLENRVNAFPVGQELTGSEIYRYTLEMLGMYKIFVYTGGRVLDLLDKIGQSQKIQLIMGPHEQDLGHAAQAYFKVTRKPSNLIVTSGPGGTNPSTVVKDAQSDSDGCILTVGQVPIEALEIGDEPFQGAPIIEAYKPWAKWVIRVTRAEDIQSVLKTAYHVATTGRPGPVVIELPSPVAQLQKAILQPLDKVPLMQVQRDVPKVYANIKVRTFHLGELVDALSKSERPITIAGGGVYNAGATKELLEFARWAEVPFATTLMLLGAMPQHKLNLGLPGMHGNVSTNLTINNSDLLVGVGNRWDDRIVGDPTKFAPFAKAIYWIEPNHPGINEIIGKRVRKIEMDAQDALTYLLLNIPKISHHSWTGKIYEWQQKYPMPNHVPRFVIEAVNRFVREYEAKEPYITTGVGAHQMFVAEYWQFNPDIGRKMLLTSGGLGTMGTGTPFAIGALIAEPDRPVYVFNGDGSLVMDQRSLLMAYQMSGVLNKHNNGLKQIVFRDKTLGMVDHWQNSFWNGRKSASELHLPSAYFKRMSEQNEFAYFLADFLVQNEGDKKRAEEFNLPVIEDFVRYRGNALLEVRLNPVPALPMIPSGKGLDSLILPAGMKLDSADLIYGKP